jgi:hypothetical protein
MARVVSLLPLAAPDLAPSPAVKSGLMERIAREPRPMVGRGKRLAWWAAIAASAAVLLATGSITGYLVGNSGNDDSQLQAELRRQKALVQAAAKGTMVMSEGRDGEAWAAVVRAPGATWGYVWVDGLPALPEGKVYQTWLTHDGTTFQPGATFDFSKGGVWVQAQSAFDSYAGLALTVENSGGQPTPSGAMIVKVPFGQSPAGW